MSTPPASRSIGPLLVILVVAAVAFGVAAAFLVGPSPKLPHPPSVGGQLDISLPLWAAALLALLPVVVGFVGIFLRGRAEGSVSLPGWIVACALVGMMVLLVFVLVSRGGSSGGSLYYVVYSPGNNTTGNTTNHTGHGVPIGPPGVGITIPAWAVWIAVGGIVALVGAVGWAIAASRPGRGIPRRPTAAAADPETRAALAEAANELGQGGDPRTVVLRLYARLLARVGPMTGDLGPWTPEEIRVVRLAGIGLSGPSVEALTRLFEEARYSSHPMGPEAAARALRAIQRIEQEIDAKGVAA